MKAKKLKSWLCIFAVIFLCSCGGEDPATLQADNDSTITVVETADHTLDSAILAAYEKLNLKMQGVDSLLYNLHLIELSDDTLLTALLNDSSGKLSFEILDSIVKDTTAAYEKAEAERKAAEAEEAKRVADSLAAIKKVDPLRPPAGQTQFYKYHLFTAHQPKDDKPDQSFPKALIGTFYNTVNRNVEVQITSSTLIYRNEKQEIVMLLSADQVVKEDKNNYLFNYKVTVDNTPYWVVDRVTIEKDTLYFRIIPPNDMSKNPSKKELRKYLEENNTAIINSFIKL